MILRGRESRSSMRNMQDVPIFGLGILFFLTFLMVPILVPESNTSLASAVRFSAATFYGKSTTDLNQDIIGFRAMVAHENAYPILNGLNSTHLPTTFLFVAPIAFLPRIHANMAWAFLMLLGMFWTFRLMGLNWLRAIGFGCLSILWPPVMLSFGQFTILWLLLVTLAHTMRNRNPLASGILIGTATLIKLFPAVMLIPFLFQKKWSAIYGFLSAMMFGIGSAFLISPEAIYKYLSLQENIQSTILRSDNSSLFNVGYQWFGMPGLVIAIFLLAAFLLLNRKQLGIREPVFEEGSWMVWTFLSVALLPVVWIYSLVPLLDVVFHFLLSKNTVVKCIGWAALILPICGLPWGYGTVSCVVGTTLVIGIGITIVGNNHYCSRIERQRQLSQEVYRSDAHVLPQNHSDPDYPEGQSRPLSSRHLV